ncbi:MAG TPA: hypothetical protein VM095_10225 [Pyrinomonadaceae bacterium]|nr:hypothetical protein [Pyrinomonadaceae bacterium]
MKQRFFIGFLVCSLFLFAACSKGQTTEQASNTSSESKALAKGESANWKVEIVSVKADKSYARGPGTDVNVLSLKLRLKYLGSSGVVQAPLADVVYITPFVKSKEMKAFPNGFTVEGSEAKPEDLGLVEWMLKGQRPDPRKTDIPQPESKTSLETGKEFQVILNYEYNARGALAASGFRLEFADVRPIPFEVAKS